ncbi:chromate efflux transporter [uncultured Maritalea sp.]|uniref:chromate efflux transporter n=1 Tax=uncultured Maritalea sp. TaxID=757249 RepID=UPI002616363C|nr:chromate efflux transporter [uncultured Maritalea sp.]
MSRPLPEIFAAFTRLGLTSFGGPVAHMSFFRAEFVTKRKWLSESAYADLVALCQFLPGPSSSQVGFALGLQRGGLLGGLAAFTAFTLPSAVFLVLFALFADTLSALFGTGLIHGLKLVATAVVAQAILGMSLSLCNTRTTATIAILSLLIVTIVVGPLGQIAAILFGAILGRFAIKSVQSEPNEHVSPLLIPVSAANSALIIFVVLLFGLPILAQNTTDLRLELFDSFYRAGALVFGGGHVVLPLLETEVVATGIVNKDSFLAGYGMTQAVPGPIFSFAAFLGAASAPLPGAILNALIATIAIFLPGFLLVYAIMPYWQKFRTMHAAKSLLSGANAAVVGLLGAAFYSPIWQSTVLNPLDFALVAMAFVLLTKWNVPPWLMVLVGAIVGSLLGML